MTPRTITLPPRRQGDPLVITPATGRLVIIGANGAGKTRFARRAADDAAPNSYRVSALHAIFGDDNHATSPNATSTRQPDLEDLLQRLMHDEMINLLTYKFNRDEFPGASIGGTPLDHVMTHWQEVFPDNRVLIESGKILFGRGDDTGSYSSLRLSTGEKAVLYYLAAIYYARPKSIIFVDNPDMFLHPSLTASLWNRLELTRPDCTFVYVTHDLEFAVSRTGAPIVWVRDCDIASMTWDYDILPHNGVIPDQVYLAILGSRKPILFIEGDAERSIDAKLYPLIFEDYTVQPLGSCNKVIESTRTFNDLATFHHLDSHGIVDRDRRDAGEVEYLRRKKIFVPEVAEIENILMLEEVVRTVAASNGKNEDSVFSHVSRTIVNLFKANVHQQALQHTRHRVKRFMEYRTDGRFSDINMLEQHLEQLMIELNARGLYENYCREFRRYAETRDYNSILRVFNQKSMVSSSNVAQLCGIAGGRDEYVGAILAILRRDGEPAERIRRAVLRCFGLLPGEDSPQAESPAGPAADTPPGSEAEPQPNEPQSPKHPHFKPSTRNRRRFSGDEPASRADRHRGFKSHRRRANRPNNKPNKQK
ncbi:MAG: DUF4435 domain-containing protein [Clostridium sp.]|nr:DUF4435 domain-containing protein [Clostridium sp.]